MDKLLILGGTGMLGHALLRQLAATGCWEVRAAVRDLDALPPLFPQDLRSSLVAGLEVENPDSLPRLLAEVRPAIVINAVGLVKQGGRSDDPLRAIAVNALYPHRLSLLCQACGARLIQISTDCVFDGVRGGYRETDPATPGDLYGRSKLLGEVVSPGCLTLRTSIIGHELKYFHGLLEWFLAQTGAVKGFSQAFFSGLSTLELARVLADHVLPDPTLTGLFHLSTARISKEELLQLIRRQYKKEIEILPCSDLRVDRSLDSSAFRQRTGYVSPSWAELVRMMHEDFLSAACYGQRS